jgi:hypothetical protein
MWLQNVSQIQKFFVFKPGLPAYWISVHNALKFTYQHLILEKIFLGSLALAIKRRKEKGREGKGGSGEGRGEGDFCAGGYPVNFPKKGPAQPVVHASRTSLLVTKYPVIQLKLSEF